MNRNDGLSSANFLGGAMQGYQFMQGVEDNKQRAQERKQMAGLRDADAARQTEQFAMQKQQHNQNNELHSARMRKLAQEEQEGATKALARQLYAIDSGTDLSPEERDELIKATGGSRLLDPSYLSSPEVGEALEIYPQVMGGQIDRNDPRALKAYNTILNVQRGAKDGRQVQINKVVPSKDGQGVHVGLHVKNADGTENPNGVLTDSRSSDPNDPVSTISFDEINGVYGATKNLRDLVNNPKYRQTLYRQYGFGTQPISAKDQSIIDKNKAQANLYNSKSANEKNGGSGGKGGDTATKKDIEYFQSLGYSKEDSVDMVVNRGASPSQEIFGMAKIIMESSKENSDGPPTVSLKEAINQAQSVYKEKFQKSPSGKENEKSNENIVNDIVRGIGKTHQQTPIPMRVQSQAPAAAIEFLKANPDQAENFKAKYGYLPE